MQILGRCFIKNWLKVCEDYGTILSDVALLHDSFFTHVNHGLLTRAWLDHCFSSQTFHNSISEVCVKYECQCSDHLSVVITMNYGALRISVISEETADKIKWEFSNQSKANAFYGLVCSRMRELEHHRACAVSPCDKASHKLDSNNMWSCFIDLVIQSSQAVFGLQRKRHQTVPGWNSCVEDLYDLSRQAFLSWRDANSPRDGVIAESMHRHRKMFKAALRQCRRHEQSLREQLWPLSYDLVRYCCFGKKLNL